MAITEVRETSWAQSTREAKEALRRAALEVVAEKGFAGLTLSAVSARADVSRGLPTYHFGSKAGLVRYVFDAVATARIEAYATLEQAGLTGLEAISASLDRNVHEVHTRPVEKRGFSLLTIEALTSDDEEMRLRLAEYDKTVTDLIARHFEVEMTHRGDVFSTTPKALAAIYISATRGAALRWISDGDGKAYADDLEILKSIFSAYLKVGDKSEKP